MREAGYSHHTADNPSTLTKTLVWQELVNHYLPDTNLLEQHKRLLNATKIEHMIFPLGPRDDMHPFLSGGGDKSDSEEIEDEETEFQERTTLTDQEIVDLLAEVNCKVRRIVHGNTARHVYFWAQDSKALKEGLDMAYKLKGSYAAEKGGPPEGGTTVNIFYDANIQLATREYESSLKKMLYQDVTPDSNEELPQSGEEGVETE